MEEATCSKCGRAGLRLIDRPTVEVWKDSNVDASQTWSNRHKVTSRVHYRLQCSHCGAIEIGKIHDSDWHWVAERDPMFDPERNRTND